MAGVIRARRHDKGPGLYSKCCTGQAGKRLASWLSRKIPQLLGKGGLLWPEGGQQEVGGLRAVLVWGSQRGAGLMERHDVLMGTRQVLLPKSLSPKETAW